MQEFREKFGFSMDYSYVNNVMITELTVQLINVKWNITINAKENDLINADYPHTHTI